MWFMSVTLEVSRLRGWLNALAPCVKVGHKGRKGGSHATYMSLSRREGLGDGHGYETHIKHALHVGDPGRVKTQRLVECLRFLCVPS